MEARLRRLVLPPHIALAPHNPGLDPVLGLSSAHREDRLSAVDRLVAVLEAAFGPQHQGAA